MKNKIRFIKVALLFIRLSVIIIFITASCKRDSCENVVCSGNKICFQGVCQCPTGYEGQYCDTLSADKYVGNYQVYQNCINGLPSQYPSNIVQGNYVYEIYIGNMIGQGLQCRAIINVNDIQIPSQNLGATPISGYGNYNPANGHITLHYQYSQNGIPYDCTADYYK